MNKAIIAIAATCVMATSFSAAAADKFYGVAQMNYTNWKVDQVNTNNSIGAGFGIGLNLNKWAAVEVTYDYLGTAGNDGFVSDNSADSVALWAVVNPTVAKIANMPLRIVGRVGIAYTTVSIDLNNPNLNESLAYSDQAIAYGGGLALGVTEHSDIVLDYRHRNIDGFGVELDAVTIGFKHAF